MIAFHYPPYFGSSGILRTLKFSQYLPENGWECLLLTASPRAYAQSEAEARKGAIPIPAGVTVTRTFALDAARHLRVGGYYPSFLAMPDRWISWWPSAVMNGRRLIEKLRPGVIWSTYPIATTHLIANSLQARTRLPWVADFRDSMTEENYPADPRRRRMYRSIERKAVEHAARVVFTTRGTAAMYRERYAQTPTARWTIIPNGYDEENFSGLASPDLSKRHDGRLMLLHTGVLYPHERDPRAFFSALAQLKRNGTLSSSSVRIVFRATGHDEVIAPMLASFDVADLVELAPSVPYTAALREMQEADALLVFQAANSNHQIPAKAYEYMRAGRPILAITDPAGDTAELLRSAGIDTIARLDDAADIAARLGEFLQRVRAGAAPIADRNVAITYSRRSQAAQLARLLDEVYANRDIRANGA